MRKRGRIVPGQLGSSFILSPATTPCCVRDKRLHSPTESPLNIGPQDWSRFTLKGPLNALAKSLHKLQMFERYTEKARRAVFFARFEASQSASATIEPEHMLLGVLRDNEELFVKLTSLPDPSRTLRKTIQPQIPPSQVISTSVELPLSAPTRSVLMKAFEESEAMGHKHIGPEHLLLGLLGERESLAAKALEMSGINAENIRNVVGTGVREKPVAA